MLGHVLRHVPCEHISANAFGVARGRPPPNRFPKTTRLALVLEMDADSSDRVEPICQQAFVVQCQSWKTSHGQQQETELGGRFGGAFVACQPTVPYLLFD